MNAEGWFPDPESPGRERYMDKNGWTRRVRYYAGTPDEWEDLLPPEINRGKVAVDTSAFSEGSPPSHRNYPKQLNPESGRSGRNAIGGGNFILFAIGVIAILMLLRGCGPEDWRIGIDGDGYRIQCEDGTWSNSGGNKGACSWHGGVK